MVNEAETLDAPLTEAAREDLKASRRRQGPGDYLPLAALAIAPVAMTATWVWTRDMRQVNGLGTWIFCASQLALLAAYFPFRRASSQIQPLEQDYAITLQGPRGPFRHAYARHYDFDRFTVRDLQAYRRMRVCSSATMAAFFATAGFVFTLFLGPRFWS